MKRRWRRYDIMREGRATDKVMRGGVCGNGGVRASVQTMPKRLWCLYKRVYRSLSSGIIGIYKMYILYYPY